MNSATSSIIDRPPRSRQPVVIPLPKNYVSATNSEDTFDNDLTKNTSSSFAFTNNTYNNDKFKYEGTLILFDIHLTYLFN